MTGSPADWFANEALWIETYPYMFPKERFEAADAQVTSIMNLTGCDGGALLDLCCGPGRHAIPFARRGFTVTAVDRTDFLLEKGRAYADEEGVVVEWIARDMRHFVRESAFELAINLFTSFGFFDDPDDNFKVLSNAFQSLKAGGAFVLDVSGKEIIARIFEATGSYELPDGGLLVQRRRVIDDWSRMDNEWLLIRDNEIRLFRLRHWIYSGRELRQLLVAAGFETVDIFGNLEGAPYDASASRLVAVARKAA